MKRLIHFSRFFLPAAIISTLIIVSGIVSYIVHERQGLGGFNLGVDFKAGLMQEIQFAPQALSLRYTGPGNARITFSGNAVNIIVTGTSNENITHSFRFSEFLTLSDLIGAMREKVAGLSAVLSAPFDTQSEWLLENAQSDPQLGETPYVLHYLAPQSSSVDIADVRDALSQLGTVSVQVLGEGSERRFMIRMEDDEKTGEIPAEKVLSALQEQFGTGNVVV
ncbi:MAG: protein translocase subunit SecF, partial [Spirochaetaceae bacterium]|nr:protein translocase subunit SecF [Spirochaetaceae bacterium]